jgi:hypothetical protein
MPFSSSSRPAKRNPSPIGDGSPGSGAALGCTLIFSGGTPAATSCSAMKSLTATKQSTICQVARWTASELAMMALCAIEPR